jgi:hypothetical protein
MTHPDLPRIEVVQVRSAVSGLLSSLHVVEVGQDEPLPVVMRTVCGRRIKRERLIPDPVCGVASGCRVCGSWLTTVRLRALEEDTRSRVVVTLRR